MKVDLLKTDLTNVKTRIVHSPVCRPPFFDGKQMYDYINATKACTQVDVVTYTVSPHRDLSKKVRRLIYSIGVTRLPHKRRFADIHSKLLILLDADENVLSAFVGSQNLVAPTLHNLMYHITDRPGLVACCEYFESLWNQ